MKSNFSHFIGFTIMLTTLVIFTSNAQEGVPSNEIPDLNFHQDLQEDKPLLIEPTNNTERADRTSQSREQVISTPKSGKSKSSEASKATATKPEEQDPLSFNFLYYIIQKFKISDIVEQ